MHEIYSTPLATHTVLYMVDTRQTSTKRAIGLQIICKKEILNLASHQSVSKQFLCKINKLLFRLAQSTRISMPQRRQSMKGCIGFWLYKYFAK